jgi:hypothetical protein
VGAISLVVGVGFIRLIRVLFPALSNPTTKIFNDVSSFTFLGKFLCGGGGAVIVPELFPLTF